MGLTRFINDDYSGGLNDTAPSDSIPRNMARSARNFNFIFGGSGRAGLQKRLGSIKLNSSAFNSGAAWTDLEQLRTPSANFIVGICGDKIAKQETTDGTWDDISAALTITPNSGNNLFTHTEMHGNLIFSNGVDAPIKWAGSGNAAVLGGSPPLGRSVIHVNNYLIFARDSTNTRYVNFSDLNAPESYTSTHFLQMGTEPTALGAIDNNLYVFELFKITRVPITVWPFPRDEVVQGVGCVGPRALENIGGIAIIFMAATGRIYVYDGSALVDVSSGLIETEINNMNEARRKYVVMRNYQKRKQIWISYSAGASTTNNKILIYDYTKGVTVGAWMVFTGISANAMASIVEQRSSGEGKEVFFTGDYAGYVRQQDTGSTDDEDTNGIIDAYYESGWDDYGEPLIVKNTRFAHVLANDAGESLMEMALSFDGQNGTDVSESFQLTTGSAVFGTAIFGVSVFGGNQFSPFMLSLPGIGRYIKYSFRSSRATDTISLLRALAIEYEVIGKREKESA